MTQSSHATSPSSHAASSAGNAPALPAGYTLRDFTLADYEAAIALWRATEGVGLTESDSREAIGVFLQRNPNLSVVVVDFLGSLVGAVLAGHDGRRGYLHHLAVVPAHRKKGLGRTMVETCLSRFAALGIAKCNIFLYAHNQAGRAFWVRQGWVAREDLVVVQRVLR